MSNSKLSQAIETMMKINKMHHSMIELKAKEIGMHRTQHKILMHLARDGMLPSQKELAERLNVSPAAITVALRKIEHDGYIERTLGQDTRYNEIKITEKGRALVNKTRELFLEVDTAMFDGFTDEELDTYISFLEKMQSNIQNHTN